LTCSCGYTFCQICKDVYHFRINCNQFRTASMRWNEWNSNGRDKYYSEIIINNKEYKMLKEKYDRDQMLNKKRNEFLHQRYKELISDEEWKSNNCRRCPSCNRPVQKIEGCPTMVCGRDAHGGNTQQGCGRKFNYNEAPQYIPEPGELELETLSIQMPTQQQWQNHLISCSKCSKVIIGLLFSCINCECYNLCEECERGIYTHLEDHVFDIIQNYE